MTDIFSGNSQVVLGRFARSNVLVAFDFDGTLAPIVALPDRARMRGTTYRLFQKMAGRYPCIVISGRARADVAGRLRGIPLVHVSGNHGIEPWAEEGSYVAQVRAWAMRLEQRLTSHPGVFVEDKTYSVAIHYRAARNKRAAMHAIAGAVSELGGSRRIGGKQVLNLVPRDAPGKAAALEHARRLTMCDTAVYVGDDQTDEEAFVPSAPGRLLSVRVGPTRRSRARYQLEDQRDIDRLLRQLLAFRPRPVSRYER